MAAYTQTPEMKAKLTPEVKSQLDKLSTLVNRSMAQTTFLWGLCHCDMELLCRLESKKKNNFVAYCPGDLKEVGKILNTPTKNVRVQYTLEDLV